MTKQVNVPVALTVLVLFSPKELSPWSEFLKTCYTSLENILVKRRRGRRKRRREGRKEVHKANFV